MGNFMYGEWQTLDSSWDPGNQKGIYSITSEYSGFMMAGNAKLDYITVKKKVSLFKTEKTKYTIDKIKKVSLIDEEVVKGKSFTKKAVAGGLGYLFLGGVGLAAGALSAGNDALKKKVEQLELNSKIKNGLLLNLTLEMATVKIFLHYY